MAAQKVLIVASAFFVQAVFGQSYVTGNTIIENIVVDNGPDYGYGLNGLANNGYGLANSGYGLANSGYGLANSGYGLANSGYGLANSGYGLANAGLVGIGGSVGTIGAGLTTGVGTNFLAYPDLLNIVSSGPLTVTSISPIGPSGLAVASENEIVGVLTVTGALPFLSAVAFEGAFPTAGSGVATCGCGNGAVGILSEGFPTVTPGPVIGIGSGIGNIYY